MNYYNHNNLILIYNLINKLFISFTINNYIERSYYYFIAIFTRKLIFLRRYAMHILNLAIFLLKISNLLLNFKYYY